MHTGRTRDSGGGDSKNGAVCDIASRSRGAASSRAGSGGGSWLRGHVTTIALIAGVTGLFSVGAMWSMRLPSAAMLAAALVPDGDDVRSAMQRAGLVADYLAASGVVSGDIAAVVDDATTYMNTNHGSLLTADADVSDARSRVGRYTRLIQSGTRDQATSDALATAGTDLATAEASQQSLLGGLFTAAAASLTQGEKDILTILRAQSTWTMPVQYLCVSRSDADLLKLRNAVAHKRIAEASGEDMDSAVETLLTTTDGETEVATAKTALDTHLASVSSTLATELDF